MVTRTTPSTSEAVETYLEQRKPFVAHNTFKGYQTTLRRFASFVGSKQIGRVTINDVIDFIVKSVDGTIGGTALSPRTTQGIKHRLTGFFRWARQRRYSSVFPESISLPKVGNVRKDYIRLTPRQMRDLIENCDHARDRIFAAIAINTGLRSHSITAIRIKDVHLDQGYIYVKISKTHEVDRLMITEDLDYELRRWLTWYTEHVGTLDPEYFLVPAKQGHTFLGPNRPKPKSEAKVFPTREYKWTNEAVRVQLKKLGYSDEELRKEGAHTLRRSAAVAFRDLLIQNGITDKRPVSAFLHHKSESTTDLYLGWDRDKEIRDEALSGKGFLSALTEKPDNVVSLDDRRKA